MALNIELQRFEQLAKFVPSVVFCRPLLYIGANKDRFHFYKDIAAFGQFDVLEKDPERAKDIIGLDGVKSVWVKDVRNADEIKEKYDAVLWSHGPSTLPIEDFIPTLEKLETLADRLVCMLTPWGHYKHDPENPLDRNITALFPEDFLNRGYAVATLGLPNYNGSNILTWKYV